MGREREEVGKRVRWTWGVQAPAARTREVQGIVVSSCVEVFRRVVVERVPDGVRVIEIGLAGWWRWTFWERHLFMRKRQRSRGSLLRYSARVRSHAGWDYVAAREALLQSGKGTAIFVVEHKVNLDIGV
jgi:hypothetical protein